MMLELAVTAFALMTFVSIGMNVFQQIYWSRQTHKLIDKLMSRSYAEYVQVSKQPVEPALVSPTEANLEEVNDEELEALNKIMGAGFV